MRSCHAGPASPAFSNGKACVWDDRFSNELAPLIEEADDHRSGDAAVLVYVPGPAESRDRQDSIRFIIGGVILPAKKLFCADLQKDTDNPSYDGCFAP